MRIGTTYKRGDVVLICKHLFEQSSCKVAPEFPGVKVAYQKFDSPETTKREDGSSFAANWAVACLDCAAGDPHAVDYVETRWDGSRLLTSDYAS